MQNKTSNYELRPHGIPGLRISVYSEHIYGSLPHHHEEYCLFHMSKGCLLFGIDGHEFYVQEGDTIFVEPNTTYYILINEHTSQPGAFHYYSIVFDGSLFGNEEDLCYRFLRNIHINTRLSLDTSALALLPQMRHFDIDKPFGYELYLKSALFQILSDIIVSGQFIRISNLRKTSAEKTSDAVSYILSYIKEHYTEKLTIEDLARNIGYSTSHIHRIFKQYTGMSIIRYLNRYRVDKACHDLMYTKKKITQIALDNGFEHGKNFSKTFHDCMGISPMQYRKIASSLNPPQS